MTRLSPRSSAEPFGPLGLIIAARRRELSLSLDEIARRVNRFARAENHTTSYARNAVYNWIARDTIPYPDVIRWIALALDMPVPPLRAAADQQRNQRVARRIGALTIPAVQNGPASVDSEDVERRAVNKLLAMLGASAVTGIDVDRFASILAGTRADDAALGDFERITMDLVRREATVTPQSLMPAVRGHLKGLRDMLVWTSPRLAARAYALAGQTALLAGYLLFKQYRHTDADAYWSLADRFSQESGDGRLRAALLVLRAQRWEGESLPREGENNPLSLALLNQAASTLGLDPDPIVAAHVLTFRACAYAEASHLDSTCSALALQDLESLQTHLSRMPVPDASLYIVESIRGEAIQKGAMALVHLGRPAEAAAKLQGLLSSVGQASLSWRAGITTYLAIASAAKGEPEQACGLLSASLQLASQASASRAVNRVLHARQRWLGRYDGSGALHLDEHLRSMLPAQGGWASGALPSA